MALRTPLSVTPHLYMGDSTGRPLDKGVVYFGEQDKDPEFYPIELFSDDALTKPLMQPVNTKGGYLYDKGDMVEPHAKEIIYSVKVLDSYGRKVFYKGAMMRNSWNDDVIEQINTAIIESQAEAQVIFDNAATDVKNKAIAIVNDAINNTAVEGGVLADTFVTMTANTAGAVARNLRDVNSETISVKDFGVKGDGTDESAKLRLAISAIPKKASLDFVGLQVSVGTSIYVEDKSHFVLKNGSIKALPTMISNAEQPVIRFRNCEWFSMNHMDVDGNRDARTPAEKVVHNIQIMSSKNWALNFVNSINPVCDGLYINSISALDLSLRPTNGVINNSNFDNAFRNNVSIIVGADIEFNKCSFTNANGTLPMAGVDLETNRYGVDALIENITFNNCNATGNNGWQILITSHDDPKNIRINGGVITSNKGMRSSLGAGDTGGIAVSNSDTYLDGVLFKDCTENSGFAFRLNPEPKALMNIKKCVFKNNSDSDVYLHSLSGGGVIADCEFSDGGGLIIYSANTKLKGLRLKDMNAIGILGSTTAINMRVEDCVITGGSDRAVLIEADNAVVTDNIVKDILGADYYIRVTGSGAVIDDNILSSTDSIDIPLIRALGATAKSISNNTAKSGSTTVDEFDIGLSAASILTAKAKITGNIGGAASQHRGQLLTVSNLATCTSSSRPSAASYPRGTQLFDLSEKMVITTDGTDWMVDGRKLSDSVLRYSEITTLDAVPANTTIGQEFTLTGVTVGMSAIASYDVNLQGVQMWAEVTSANKVTVYRTNNSAISADGTTARLTIKASKI